MQAWSSGASGRPAVKSLQQEEVRMEAGQHQRARTDSDHHSAHIPLQGGKKEKRKDFSSFKSLNCKSEVKLHCFLFRSYTDISSGLLKCN